MPRTYKRVAAGRSTTTETLYALAGRGIAISRDQLYVLSDVLFDPTSIQPSPKHRRHYSPEQIELLATAHWLRQLGRSDEEIRSLLNRPEALDEVRPLVEETIHQINVFNE